MKSRVINTSTSAERVCRSVTIIMIPLLASVILLATKACQTFSRSDASRLLDESILPSSERGERIGLGTRNDKRIYTGVDLFETYGEFPLESLDMLLDLAQQESGAPFKNVLDLGSGCGRLAIYMALTREQWHVQGVEISEVFHNQALKALDHATEYGCFQNVPGSAAAAASSISLHLGPANNFPALLQHADVIFCYSTAFESSHFSEESSALVLAASWSELLSAHCRPGCVCITTDKVLDPARGWRLLSRLDVPNPEVVGSTGFVQVFDGPRI